MVLKNKKLTHDKMKGNDARDVKKEVIINYFQNKKKN